MKERVVELYYIQSNNHGCSGERIIIIPLNEREGVVKSCYACSRCYDPLPFREGDIVVLPEGYDWERASRDVTTTASFSFAGETMVRPSELMLAAED